MGRWSCSGCGGSGLGWSQHEHRVIPCRCVLREMFRACYRKWRAIQEKPAPRRQELEYGADFFLVARRSLTAPEFMLFRLHFLEGVDWKACCPRLGIDRGRFFHAVYRVEETLGRVFAELEPYALFPPRVYFAPVVRGHLPLHAAPPK